MKNVYRFAKYVASDREQRDRLLNADIVHCDTRNQVEKMLVIVPNILARLEKSKNPLVLLVTFKSISEDGDGLIEKMLAKDSEGRSLAIIADDWRMYDECYFENTGKSNRVTIAFVHKPVQPKYDESPLTASRQEISKWSGIKLLEIEQYLTMEGSDR